LLRQSHRLDVPRPEYPRCAHRCKSPYIPEACTTPHEIAKRPASLVSERAAAQEGPCRAEQALLLL
jgi:hypothetical protein